MIELRVLMAATARAVRAAGREHEARKLEDAAIDRAKSFSCAMTALRHVDTSIRMAWGTTSMNPRHPLARAAEAVSLAQAGALAALAGADGSARWMMELSIRVRELAGMIDVVNAKKEPRRATRRKVAWEALLGSTIWSEWNNRFGITLDLKSAESILFFDDRTEYMIRLPDKQIAFAIFEKRLIAGDTYRDVERIEMYVTIEHVTVWTSEQMEGDPEGIDRAWFRIFGEEMPPQNCGVLVEAPGRLERRYPQDRIAVYATSGQSIEAWVERLQ